MLDSNLWGGNEVEFPFLACIAEPRTGGFILQLPEKVVAWTVSKSGAPIIRHETPPSAEPNFVTDSTYCEEVGDHIERHLGKVETVLHELISTTVHVDIHMIPPAPQRPWYTLVTSGMSDLPMNVPEGAEQFRRAELMLRLPESWKLSQEDFKDESNYWPLRWMKFLVRFPHELNTWLCVGHSIPNGDPAEPLHSSTALTGWVLSKPFVGGEGFETLETTDGELIHFFSLIAVHSSEMQLKLDYGAQRLLADLSAADVSDLLQPRRPSVVYD